MQWLLYATSLFQNCLDNIYKLLKQEINKFLSALGGRKVVGMR